MNTTRNARDYDAMDMASSWPAPLPRDRYMVLVDGHAGSHPVKTVQEAWAKVDAMRAARAAAGRPEARLTVHVADDDGYAFEEVTREPQPEPAQAPERYEVVALTGGTQGDVRARCGHHHRTREAAEKCLAKLFASHEETPGVRVSSLLWYHGRVRQVESAR